MLVKNKLKEYFSYLEKIVKESKHVSEPSQIRFVSLLRFTHYCAHYICPVRHITATDEAFQWHRQSEPGLFCVWRRPPRHSPQDTRSYSRIAPYAGPPVTLAQH